MPPRVFGPLGPNTLRGKKYLVVSFNWLVMFSLDEVMQTGETVVGFSTINKLTRTYQTYREKLFQAIYFVNP